MNDELQKKGSTRRQSKRREPSRRVLLNPILKPRFTHAARRLPAWLIRDIGKKRKILAAILLLLGAGNLVGALAGGATWETVLAVVIGVALIAVAAGILKKWSFAWPLGFTTIGLGTIHFVVSSLSLAVGKEGVERIALLSSGVIGALLVAAYWSSVWYRRRGYFFPDEPKA